ncbi:hypothetical protein BGW37DRAFT_519687 [Umbelopsis sp. PMI_123]|nr:hypothetical protein BGW37DRAFT_519687 [Umbelopsis sp. PMI_123]
MPSTTLPSSEDKNLVRRAIPTSKIFTAGVARLFLAYPNPQSWNYSNIWGATVFLKDKAKNESYFIRIIDLENHKGVIWEQELYEGFQYTQERPFFHTFDTDDCQAGLLFVDEGEAETFYNKLINRQIIGQRGSATETHIRKPTAIGGGEKPKKAKGKVDKNSIGLPSDFRHLGHIGYTPEQGFSVQNNSPEWNGIFEQLKALGISAEEINHNQEFIKDFVAQRGGPPASAPTRNAGQSPPPPPAPKKQSNATGRRPPPPPPPRRSGRPASTAQSLSPPQPPSLPSRSPPLPSRGAASPAFPSRPGAGGAPPPPPPPPPGMGGPPPPPPPPPQTSQSIQESVPAEVFSDGRSSLMASIRGSGGIGRLRKTEGPREPSPLAAAGYETSSSAAAPAAAATGGDLASSLAMALKQRKTAMQSDDEDEDDNDEWED